MNTTRKTSSSHSSQEKEPAPLSLDYDHLSRLCLKYWKWLACGVLVGAVIGLIVAFTQTTIYLATSTIEVLANKDTNMQGVPDIGRADTSNTDVLKTLEQLLQTKDLAQRVVKTEHLDDSSEFLTGVNPPVSEDAATAMLAKSVTIGIRPLTRLIDIKVEHHSPEMAKLLADRMAQESINQEFDQHVESTTILSDVLQKEMRQLQQKVVESEQALHDYQATHKEEGVSLNADLDLAGTRLKDLNQQYMNAQAQVTLLKERYGEQHPKLVQAEKQLEELGNEVRKAQDSNLDSNKLSIGYNALKSEAESNKLQLKNLQDDLNQAHTATRVTPPGIRVAHLADLPLAPVRPSKSKAVAIGGFIGLLGGLGFIFGVYFIDSSLRTVSQAESALSLPVIAAVPIMTQADGRSILPTFSDPQSFVSESFRGLRASLLLHDRENPLKTILVASAIPGEGKSFCAANLAVAFAQTGLKTLLIDADLRLPTLHTYFDVPSIDENHGLVAILTGRSTLASAVVPSAVPALELLLTSMPADSPAELLSSIRLPLLMDEVASKYDRVVIDSAPLNAVSDTMLIMPKADGILLVIRAALTPVSETKVALQKIYSSKMKPLGLILNYLAPHTLKSYSYGYSYGQKPKEQNAK